MIDLSALPDHITVPIGFMIGLPLGLGYFHALRETANLIIAGGNPLLGVALTLARMGILATLLSITVLTMGGAALVSALVGVLCAKAWMLRQLPSEAS